MPHFTDSSKYDPPMDWLQTAIGFVPVATAVSLAVTLIVRWIDKPRAVFAFEMQLQSEGSRHDKEGLIFAAIALTNIGDGTAYDVELVGDGCDVAVALPAVGRHSARYSMRLPQIVPGQTVLVETLSDESLKPRVALVVRWTLVPGRAISFVWQRAISVRLATVASAMPFPVGMLEPGRLPRSWRMRRDLAQFSERGRLQDPANHSTSEDAQPSRDN